MPQVYAVAYTTDGTNYTTLSNVQSVTVNIGRQALVDSYNASTCQVLMRYPNGFASPITQLVSGTRIRISNTTSGKIIWFGRISDVDVSYAIPYASNVGPADYMTITGEGALAAWARANGNGYSMAAGTATAQLSAAATSNGLSQTSTYSGSDNPTVAATTVSGSWGDWANKFTATLNGRIREGNNQVVFVSKYSIGNSSIGFSDTLNNASWQRYDVIDFRSLSQNYWTQVTVTPDSFGAATVQTGASPYRTLTLSTYNSSTSQATDLANYLLGVYSAQTFQIGAISAIAENQASFQLDAIGTGFWDCIGNTIAIQFRGQTYYGVIEGGTMTADPNTSRYTFYLSGSDLNSYLILNNPVLGKLNSNKLGY